MHVGAQADLALARWGLVFHGHWGNVKFGIFLTPTPVHRENMGQN